MKKMIAVLVALALCLSFGSVFAAELTQAQLEAFEAAVADKFEYGDQEKHLRNIIDVYGTEAADHLTEICSGCADWAEDRCTLSVDTESWVNQGVYDKMEDVIEETLEAVEEPTPTPEPVKTFDLIELLPELSSARGPVVSSTPAAAPAVQYPQTGAVSVIGYALLTLAGAALAISKKK